MSQPKRSFFRTPVANQHQENTFIHGEDGDIIGARANNEQNSPSFDDQLNQTNRNMEQGLNPQTTEVPVPPFYRQGLRTLGLPNHIQNQISSHNTITNQAPAINQVQYLNQTLDNSLDQTPIPTHSSCFSKSSRPQNLGSSSRVQFITTLFNISAYPA